MSTQSKFGKGLHIIGVILLGLTAVFHLLGGIGTTCVALGAEKYASMAGIVPYKWLYQIFVVVTIILSIFAIRATVALARSQVRAYQGALTILVIGLLVSGIHMAASEILRGSSAPTSMRVYFNTLTLLVFLLFRIPGIWEKMDFGNPQDKPDSAVGAGAAMILAGIATLTVQLWAGGTHTWGGVNYADVWRMQLLVIGGGLTICGIVFMAKRFLGSLLKHWSVFARLPGSKKTI